MSAHRRTSERADDQPRHRAPRKPRLRMVISSAAAVAVVSGGTAFACIGGPGHHAPASTAGHTALPVSWHTGRPHTAAAAHGHHPGPVRSSTAGATAAPAPTHTTAAPTATPVPTKPPTRSPQPTPTATRPSTPPKPSTPPRPSAPPSTTAPVTGTAAQQVLDLINKARAAQGLAPYTLLAGLTQSATAHNQVMASGCGLSHQCPGEAPIGDRETAAGVHWNGAGENIGVGGPVADTDQAIADMALNLTQGMLDEKAPDDGHRRNILSTGYTYVGIAVVRDSSGSVWLTQDFASTF